MTIALSPRTETLLREHAARLDPDTYADHAALSSLADELIRESLEWHAQDFEEACAAIAEGLADGEAGREISFDEYRAQWEAEKAARRKTEVPERHERMIEQAVAAATAA